MIELIMVILLLGVVASVALPRYVDLNRSASRAVVNQTAAVFETAVYQANLAWRIHRYAGPGLNDNVIGFGRGNVDVNAAGWPVDTNNANVVSDQARCVRTWVGIMLAAPSVSQLLQPTLNTDFKATVASGPQQCIFTYTRDTVVRSFTYHANTGTITKINP